MIFEMILEAIRSMRANRLRTFLTMLGMMIGVSAVIVMLAIGSGARDAVERSIESMGSNLFIVIAGSATTSGARSGSGGAPTLNSNDALALNELDGVVGVAPIAPGSAQVIYGANNWNTTVYGTTPSYLDVRSWIISEGGIFFDSDVRSATRVAIIGATVAEKLFGDDNPIGATIRIKQNPFTVIGVLDKKGQSFDGRDQDDTVIIPLTTAQRLLFGSQFRSSVRTVLVKAKNRETMEKLEKEMTLLLRQRHKIRDGAPDDFSIRNLTAIANQAAETTKIMSFLLGAIASVSLLVGGIGIMNIMLVSVTERTKEIGIRVAIGAQKRDILMQFLFEAVMISMLGCFIGVLIGVGGALLVSYFAQMPVVITLASIILSFFVAACIGIFFGYYPAQKASKLNPIDALRYQ